jgi:hypothetical protein
MKLFRRFINPVFAFIGIQLVWLLVVIFWIYWFMGKHRQLRTLAERYSPELAQRGSCTSKPSAGADLQPRRWTFSSIPCWPIPTGSAA